ncbi:MAG: ATPase, T2SS/T4P/T4SS family, partial [Pantoea sp.]|nr:ATPase, T2SS/T4P/T4SS family [Pantoea sp.]
MNLDEMVELSVKHNAADLHLCSGHLPYWRRQGKLETMPQQARLSAAWMAQFIDHRLDDPQRQQLERDRQLDFALTLSNGQRIRASLFMQRNGLSLALRIIAAQCPTLESLRLPPIVPALLEQRDGLILITGATGSGKSTTLAALVDALNRQQARHIITLEDPIEFIHHSQQSLIQQREIGLHCSSFSLGVKAALREDPDVILLGELRDSET